MDDKRVTAAEAEAQAPGHLGQLGGGLGGAEVVVHRQVHPAGLHQGGYGLACGVHRVLHWHYDVEHLSCCFI